MPQKNTNHPNHPKHKLEFRRIVTLILAVLMAASLVVPMLTLAVSRAGAVTQSEIDALKEQQQASKEKQAQLQSELDDIKDQKTAAEQKLSVLTQQLNAIADEIESIESQISYYDGEIAQKEVERQAAVAREEEQYELFCQRVRAMEEDGDVSYWSILFSSKDFSDLLSRLADINEIMDYDNAVMEDLVATRQQIEQLKADLETARAEQEEAKAAQEQAKAQQQAKVDESKALLQEINANAEKLNAALDAENQALAEVNAEIVKKQKELEAQRQQNNVVINTGSGYAWPLPGYYKLTSAFGYRIHPITQRPNSHTGIDIPAPAGTSILAARGGQVVTSAYHSSYGNYVVIDHGNGNSTLYAHMTSRAVSAGQMVSQGQVIGYVGTTGSSTGNHLHFEVRVNYQRVNPEQFYNLPFVRAYNW